jgi:hypothetical protein
LLKEADFGPAFQEQWQAVLEAKPLGVSSATWWDEVAKPFFRDFYQRFAKTVAHRRRETRNFLQVALASALEVEDWPRSEAAG